MNQNDIDTFVRWMKLYLPRFDIRYKDESRLQRWIGKLLWPINRHYMTAYTTVMFGKIYFPSRQIIDTWGYQQIYATLRHEFVHLMDAKRFPLWFELSYLLLLPCVLTMRSFWEWRGYVQSMLVEFELTARISQQTKQRIIDRFVGSDYGWMFPFRRWLERLVERVVQRIICGDLTGPYPYLSWGRHTPAFESDANTQTLKQNPRK